MSDVMTELIDVLDENGNYNELKDLEEAEKDSYLTDAELEKNMEEPVPDNDDTDEETEDEFAEDEELDEDLLDEFEDSFDGLEDVNDMDEGAI